MPGKTMSDWQARARESGFQTAELKSWADAVETKKEEDLARLQATRLPQYDLFTLPFREFSKDNAKLMDFFRKYQTRRHKFCTRALPTAEGKALGYTRKPKMPLLGFEDSLEHLESIIKKGEEDLWGVGISDMTEQPYGGVIISGASVRTLSGTHKGRLVYGEISRKLDKLTGGEEQPLASFVFDRGGLGQVTDKTRWLVDEDSKAREFLWQTAREHILPGDSFNPFIWPGYFEFIITTAGESKFLDYKENLGYLV